MVRVTGHRDHERVRREWNFLSKGGHNGTPTSFLRIV
jgi:hypothetical protein